MLHVQYGADVVAFSVHPSEQHVVWNREYAMCTHDILPRAMCRHTPVHAWLALEACCKHVAVSFFLVRTSHGANGARTPQGQVVMGHDALCLPSEQGG
jgi:hypothetical protein